MRQWRAVGSVVCLILLVLSLSVSARRGSRGESGSNAGSKTVHVSGYYRSDGTYVHSYDRAPPGQGQVQTSSSASSQTRDPLPTSKSRATSTYTVPSGRDYRIRDNFTGRVVGIYDGDTITVLRAGKAVTVRLYGVDAPEEKQAFGAVAKHFTSGLVFHKTVTVLVHDTDWYGRLVGEVLLPGGRSLNESVVRRGLAWWYQYYAPHDTTLAQLEQDARTAHRGLWSDPHAIPPWEFRKP
jgi:micrococcal nuclease